MIKKKKGLNQESKDNRIRCMDNNKLMNSITDPENPKIKKILIPIVRKVML